MDDYLMRSFGLRLLRLLRKHGLSQREFAVMCRTSEAAISRYISGDRCPKLTALYRMREALGCSWGELLDASA